MIKTVICEKAKHKFVICDNRIICDGRIQFRVLCDFVK